MTNQIKTRGPLAGGLLAVLVVALFAFGLLAVRGRTSAGPTQAVTAAPPRGMEYATLAAGCFWSQEAIFKQLKGVVKVEPGYAGGTLPHPSYEQVEGGDTGYAETANITFDPKVISYRELLQVLLIARDPTTLNKQGPDEGTQYRSVIFYRNAAQKQTAEQAIAQVNAAHVWTNPIVTTVQPFKTFYRAEDYHLNYYALHPDNPYCAFVIKPEITEFRAKFKAQLK
jgi:methionine-S-sulfoxide reductase